MENRIVFIEQSKYDQHATPYEQQSISKDLTCRRKTYHNIGIYPDRLLSHDRAFMMAHSPRRRKEPATIIANPLAYPTMLSNFVTESVVSS